MVDKSKTTLLLASASPRRKELLARLRVKFEVLVAPITEHEDVNAEPRAMVLHNAALKAAWVCAQRPGAWILSADTTVALDNQVLNKPADLAEARTMLKRLSGRTHTVYTGVCLWRKGAPSLPDREISHCETSEVTFRKLDDETITRYFALVNPLDKAGAYGIQEGRELILQKYRGSFSNIMGLPVEWLAGQLRGLALLPAGEVPIIEDSLFRDNSHTAAR